MSARIDKWTCMSFIRKMEKRKGHFLPFFDFCKKADFSSIFRGFRLSLIPSIARQKEPQANFSPVVPFLLVSRVESPPQREGARPPLREFASPPSNAGCSLTRREARDTAPKGQILPFRKTPNRIKTPGSRHAARRCLRGV